MPITKIDVVNCLLPTSIRLYFEDKSPLSAHTLAMASLEVIEQLCINEGIEPVWQGLLSHIEKNVSRSDKKHLVDISRMHYNFFKHSNSANPMVIDDLSDDVSKMVIVMSCCGFSSLGLRSLETDIFTAWISIVDPHLTIFPPSETYIRSIFGDIRQKPRSIQKQVAYDALQITSNGSPGC